MIEVIQWSIRIAALLISMWLVVSAIKLSRKTKKELKEHKELLDEAWRKSIVTKEGWYSTNVIKPTAGQKCKIDCGQLGERTAIYCDPRTLLKWKLTDCTHPWQNMNMYEGYVLGWKPLDNTIITEDAQFEEVPQALLN